MAETLLAQLARLIAAVEVAEAALKLGEYDDLMADEVCDECAPDEPGEYIATRQVLGYKLAEYSRCKAKEGA